MKVSVVIPNYNRTDILKRAIESVLAQSVDVAEIIVVDDCSNNFTKDYLEAEIKPLRNVKIVFNTLNMGASGSRNVGVDNAESELVAFLDSDDVWMPKKLEKQLPLFEKNTKVELVYCYQGGGNTLYRGNVMSPLIDGWIPPNPSTVVFKRSVYLSLGGFDTTLKACEDHDFWFVFSKAGYSVDFIDEELTDFTDEAENRLSHNYEIRIDALEKFIEKWKDTLVNERSLKHYQNYKREYTLKVVYPLFVNSVKQAKLISTLGIVWKYFVFNRMFYLMASHSMLRRIKRRVL
jgi:glycosyltransferase involved in cell wall biosynthesis